jgi:hypothetical protein
MPTSYSNDGTLIALLALAVFSFIFMEKNPTISIVMFDAGYVALNLIGFISLPKLGMGFMFVSSIILIYVINRKD